MRGRPDQGGQLMGLFKRDKEKPHRDYWPPIYASVALAAFALVHAVGYISTPMPPTWPVRGPSWVYSLLWLFAAVLVLRGRIVARNRLGLAGAAGVVALSGWFGAQYALGWLRSVIEGEPTRMYLIAVFYACLALYIMGTAPHKHERSLIPDADQ